MANRSKTASVEQPNSRVTLSEHETDAPILPVAQLERLNTFLPEKVEWYFAETERESAFRRTEVIRVNSFIYRERLLGQVFALVIGLAGIGVGAYVALSGHPTAGATIATVAIGTLAVVFITGKSARNDR